MADCEIGRRDLFPGPGGRSVVGLPTRLMLATIVIAANLTGSGVVFVLTAIVLPTGHLDDPGQVRFVNVVALGAFTAIAIPVGLWRGWHKLNVDPELTGEAAADLERNVVLRGPVRLVGVQAALWVLAVVVFTGINLPMSVRLGITVATTTAIGGVAICAISYLLSQRMLRRAAAKVLTAHPPDHKLLTGVRIRWVLFWMLGTAVPLGGVEAAAVMGLVYSDVSADRLAVIVLVLGGTASITGLIVTVFVSRATSDPIVAVTDALRRVEQGDLDTRVTVYDGTELGLLQAGVNRMVRGLAERERLEDLFGRHVGTDVARRALAGGTDLGGEIREVAVLFVDVVGSTTLAATRPVTEVVDMLNAFFAIVVEEVDAHGGWINKFTGDAALAVFGAPEHIDDPAGCAMAAGRVLAARLARTLPELPAGVGVAAGPAVAGNLGAARRFEYTVIGDPVNEAARLTELAKNIPQRVLASGGALAMARAAGSTEIWHWSVNGTRRLRGRTEETELAVPV